MDAAATDSPTAPTDAVHHLLLSPDRPPASGLVAKRRIREANALGSPRRRSLRLSGFLPPQPPEECHDARDTDENETSSVDDIDPHLSREDTPENDCLPPDEPSTVLANRIMRAQDNPSPPPQDLAPHNVSHAPEKDDHLLHEVSAPPSPFRPINLLERLNQLSYPPFQHSHGRRTLDLDDSAGAPESCTNSPHRAVVSHGSRVPSIPTEDVPRDGLASVSTPPLISTQRELPPQLSQQVCETTNDLVNNMRIVPPSERIVELHIQGSLEPGVFGSSFTRADDSSSSHVVSPTSDKLPQEPLPFSEQEKLRESPPLTPIVLPSTQNGPSSITTEVPFQKDNEGQTSSTDNNSMSNSKEGLEGERGMTSTEETNSSSRQILGSISPHSTSVLDGLCLPSGSLIEQTPLRAETIHNKHLSTPPRTPGSPVVHPDFSTTTVQRPIIAPTPVRANGGSGKSNSPVKFSFEIDDIYRTPARRVPIETALARGTPSFQKTAQLPMGTDQSQPGRFSTMRTPVFTRPALDDPSRSPAKRIPIADLATSRAKGHQAPSSPTRPSPRARSTSMEPRPLRPIPTRSRSVEPGVTTSKRDNLGKTKESIFPNVPVVPRQGVKLPFPLVSGHKSSQDPSQPSIPEEPETAEVGSSENNVTLGRVTQDDLRSQLKQPSTNSRIPRIGNKPYARLLPKNGKSTVGTTSRSKADVPVHKTFRLANKNNDLGNNDAEGPSAKSADDQRFGGSLKRKRGTEMAGPSDSRPVMIRQVVPGMLNEKYAPKPANLPSQLQTLPESSPLKAPQPLKFRKVVDGMLSARYAPKAQTEPPDPISSPPSPLSELSSSSNGGPDEKPPLSANPTARPETSDTSRTDDDASPVEPATHKLSSHQSNANADEFSNRLRRTSRTRKQAQQQYVLDIFNSTTSARPPPPRRKPQTRTEGDSFMGISAAALKALTASNTTKNQQTVAVLATEVIRKEGLRPESPTVKARTILQKQRDERDMRRKEREQRKSQLSETDLGLNDTKEHADSYLDTHTDDYIDETAPQKHHRGPGDEEDYETADRSERVIEPLRLEGTDRKVKPVKQVKWHRGLSTAIYLDEVDPNPKFLSKETSVRGCLAPTSKSLPLDNLGNLLHTDTRPLPEFVTEQIVVKRYIYDNDIEPEPILPKITRSKSKKK